MDPYEGHGLVYEQTRPDRKSGSGDRTPKRPGAMVVPETLHNRKKEGNDEDKHKRKHMPKWEARH